MTPAKLHALADAHIAAHEQADKPTTRKPSVNPAADLAALGAEF